MMMNKPLKNKKYSFKITSSKGQEVKSDNYNIIGIPFQFDYYTPVFSFEKVTYHKTKGLPRSLFHHSLASKAISTGYLYVYNEKDSSWNEYFVNSFQNNNSEEYKSTSTLYLDIPKSNKNSRDYERPSDLSLCTIISFQPEDIVWVAFSKVQWSQAYLSKMMNNFENIKNRFQKIDVKKFVDTCKELKENNLSGKWNEDLDNPLDNIYYSFSTDTSSSLLNDDKEDNNVRKGDITYRFCVNDSIQFVDDMIGYWQETVETLNTFLKATTAGVNPDNYEEEVQLRTPKELEQYYALFTSAASLYNMLYSKNGGFKKYTKDDKIVQREKIEKIIGVEEREQLVLNIMNAREDLCRVIQSNFYQNSLIDYLDNTEQIKIIGQSEALKHLQILAVSPFNFDSFLRFEEELEELNSKDTVKTYIIETFSDNEEDIPAEVSPMGDQNTQQVVRSLLNTPIDIGQISENSVIFVSKVLSNIDTLLSLYKNMMQQIYYKKRTFLETHLRYLGYNKDSTIFMANERLSKIRDVAKERIEGLNKLYPSLVANAMDGLSVEDLNNQGHRNKLPENPAAKNVRKHAEVLEEVVELSKAKDVNKLDRYMRDATAEIIEIDKKAVNPKFLESAGWQRLLASLSVFNLVSSSAQLSKSGKGEDVLAAGIAAVESLSLATSLAVINIEGLQAKERAFLIRLGLNPKLSIALRISFIAMVAASVLDTWRMISSINRGDYDAALCYGISAAAGVASIYYLTLLSVSGKSFFAGPVGWVLAGIGILSAIGIMFFKDDDIEAFLKSSVFTGDSGLFILKSSRQIKTEGMKPYQLAQKLYSERVLYANKSYDGMGFYDLNLRDFPNMLDWITRLSAPFSIDLVNTWISSRNFDKSSDWFYSAFTIDIEYAGVLADAKFEHEVRIYPYGTNRDDAPYLVYAEKVGYSRAEKVERKKTSGKDIVLTRNKLLCRYNDIDKYPLRSRNGKIYKGLSDYYKQHPEFSYSIKKPVVIMLGRFLLADGGYYPSPNEGNRYLGMKVNLRVPASRTPKQLYIWTKMGIVDEIIKYNIKG